MHKKLSNKDITKIRLRFNNKFEEFKLKSKEELKEIFNSKKLSSTDKHALIRATEYLNNQENKIKDETIEKE